MHFGFFFDLKAGEEATMNVPDFRPKINSRYQNYNLFRSFLNVCSSTGEAVDDSLLQLLERMIPEKRSELARMDFSKRRDEFSELIKKNEAIKKLPELDSSTKRKAITTTFAQFVKLRNYYTHGKLILNYEKEEYYIQIINKSTGIKMTYGIDRNILKSFLDVGTDLIQLFSIISHGT
ncbi:hypothetical protein DBR43_07820 [Pedobacter sp. KBW06]|nr:hypothetical protein DBR43_07820 [Pedobacter sp. KBW06]